MSKSVKKDLFSLDKISLKTKKMQEPRNCQVFKDELIKDHLLKTFIPCLPPFEPQSLIVIVLEIIKTFS